MKSDIKSYTATELDAGDFSVQYLIKDVLVAGQPAILAGPRKCLKTTIASDMALAIATGGHFLGKFPVTRKGRVRFASGESGLGTLQNTARRIATKMGTSLPDVGDMLHVTEWLPRFDDANHLELLERWIRENALDVVFIDPAYLCVTGDSASNLFIMGQQLREASQVFLRTKSTMILVHHARKNQANRNPFAPLELEEIAWSGFQEFARQWILLNRREAYQTGTGEHRLWLSVGGSAGHSALWGLDASEGAFESRHWDTNVLSPADVKNDAAERKERTADAKETGRLQKDTEKLLSALSSCPDGETKNVLKAKTKLSGEHIQAALDEAKRNGQIVPCSVKRANNQSYPGFKLTN